MRGRSRQQESEGLPSSRRKPARPARGMRFITPRGPAGRGRGLDLAVLVLYNRILGYQKHAENVKFGDHTDAVYLSDVDSAAVAQAAGCRGIRVREAAELPRALDAALGEPGPALVDILSDPKAYPPITSFEGQLAV